MLRLDDNDGLFGHGEAAPAPAMTGETAAEVERRFRDYERDPTQAERVLEDATHRPGRGEAPAARGALVAAALDVEGQRTRVALHRLLNLPEGDVDTSITVTLGTPQACVAQAEEWDRAGWPILKVKLGGDHDEAVIRALRDRFPEKRLRVDANEAWSPQVAAQRFQFLERQRVEFVEQPLPRTLVAESAELARKFDLPIILDEPLLDAQTALELVRADAGDGGNIKLAKCGGVLEARRIVKVLRDADWKVMMGCMLETSLGLATAASFAGVLDYADLDGNVTLREDPFTGFDVREGRVHTPTGPGIGVRPAQARLPLELLG